MQEIAQTEVHRWTNCRALVRLVHRCVSAVRKLTSGRALWRTDEQAYDLVDKPMHWLKAWQAVEQWMHWEMCWRVVRDKLTRWQISRLMIWWKHFYAGTWVDKFAEKLHLWQADKLGYKLIIPLTSWQTWLLWVSTHLEDATTNNAIQGLCLVSIIFR